MKETSKYSYYAFISYKREDERWAKWLQHKLEYYKLPIEIRRDKPELKDGIRPIFKDTTDLEPGVLAEKIRNALDSSRYLIVICSPRSANSIWVSKEVQSFIDSGRTDNIIPFIIGGTPNAENPKDECFPEGLRKLVGSREILGANINEMGRDAAAIKVVARMFNVRFDTLWQRYSRYKKIRNLVIVSIICFIALLASVFSISIWNKNNVIKEQNEQLSEYVANLQRANDTIRGKNTLIEGQNKQLTQLVANLQQANDTILGKNLLIEGQNKQLTQLVANLQQANNTILGKNTLIEGQNIRLTELVANLQIAKDTIEVQNTQLTELVMNLQEANKTYSITGDGSKPYKFVGQLRGNYSRDYDVVFATHPYEPIIAFADNLGYWLHYINSNVEIQLPVDKFHGPIVDVADLRFSSDGSKLFAICYSGSITWNIESHRIVNIIDGWGKADEYMSSTEFAELFSDNERYANQKMEEVKSKYSFKIENGKILIIDKMTNKNICSTDFTFTKDEFYENNIEDYYHIVSNPIYDEFIIATNVRAALYDCKKNAFTMFFTGYNNMYNINFSETGEYVKINNLLFERAFKIDTITNLKCEIHPIMQFPHETNKIDYKYDSVNDASIKFLNEKDDPFVYNILYKRKGKSTKINVLNQSTIGNGAEFITDALFAGPNRIVVLIEQGNHRVYSTETGTLLGALENCIWEDCSTNYGLEDILSHAEFGIIEAKYMNKRLYTVSTGGIIRIYNVEKLRLETLIELPHEDGNRCVRKIFLNDDASFVYYAFDNDDYYFKCNLPKPK